MGGRNHAIVHNTRGESAHNVLCGAWPKMGVGGGGGGGGGGRTCPLIPPPTFPTDLRIKDHLFVPTLDRGPAVNVCPGVVLSFSWSPLSEDVPLIYCYICKPCLCRPGLKTYQMEAELIHLTISGGDQVLSIINASIKPGAQTELRQNLLRKLGPKWDKNWILS